jgi:NADPH-dependent 2,4-dienoyl-CoA reductase/sulfur reductase-like enzyme
LDADLVEGTYAERNIELVLGRRATTLDPKTRTVGLDDGTANLRSLADRDRRRSGATADSGRALPVLYLRSWADGRAIVERAAGARRVLVIGASFIGLEVSASLRKRGIEVDVVAPDKLPLERVMGAEIGRLVQSVHESNGVRFHLGQTVASVNGRTIMLSGGDTFDADFIVVGVGVRPALGLGEAAGLSIDKGIVVNEYLETSAPNVYAAGDNARWPDPHTGKSIRVEHWVVAQRQGQTAARNMLGRRERFDAVPFFWSRHFDMAVSYVGHAEQPRYAVSSYDGKELQGHLLAERQDRGGDDRRQRESLIARRLERT